VYQLVGEQRRDPDLEPAVLFAHAGGPFAEAIEALGCTVLQPQIAHGYSALSVPSLTRQMRGFDVHHFHGAEPLVMSASLGCRGALRIYTQRAGVAGRPPIKKRIRYAITGAILRRRFHGVSGNTRYAVDCAASLYGLDPQHSHVTYNGFEFGLLEPVRPPEQVRDELGLDEGDFVLGTAANLKHWKRIDRLLDLLAAIDEPRLRLVIVGDGEAREALEARAAELGVAERVAFTGLQLQVGDYLQVMDAFCLPSTSRETFGNAAVEAMSAGLPTIVFADGGGMVEHIEPGDTGFVVADEAELAQVVRRLLAEPELGQRIGARGRAAARDRYTVEAAARGYKRLYDAAQGGT
jgi:glycosyltransferase involved in cell wall biosynthesis